MAELPQCGIKTWSVDHQQEHASLNLFYYPHLPGFFFFFISPLSRYICLEYESIDYSYNWKSGKDSCISKKKFFITVYIHLNAISFRFGMLQSSQYFSGMNNTHLLSSQFWGPDIWFSSAKQHICWAWFESFMYWESSSSQMALLTCLVVGCQLIQW